MRSVVLALMVLASLALAMHHHDSDPDDDGDVQSCSLGHALDHADVTHHVFEVPGVQTVFIPQRPCVTLVDCSGSRAPSAVDLDGLFRPPIG